MDPFYVTIWTLNYQILCKRKFSVVSCWSLQTLVRFLHHQRPPRPEHYFHYVAYSPNTIFSTGDTLRHLQSTFSTIFCDHSSNFHLPLLPRCQNVKHGWQDWRILTMNIPATVIQKTSEWTIPQQIPSESAVGPQGLLKNQYDGTPNQNGTIMNPVTVTTNPTINPRKKREQNPVPKNLEMSNNDHSRTLFHLQKTMQPCMRFWHNWKLYRIMFFETSTLKLQELPNPLPHHPDHHRQKKNVKTMILSSSAMKMKQTAVTNLKTTINLTLLMAAWLTA